MNDAVALARIYIQIKDNRSANSVLEKANASEADMIIAVTRSDEVNMLISLIAHSKLNISKQIQLRILLFVFISSTI